jgi:hypothetical protein
MRFLVIAVATGFLLAPVSTPASARSGVSLNPVQTVEFSAAKMKNKKEKVEYMRSAAGPEPKVKKTKKIKTKKTKK